MSKAGISAEAARELLASPVRLKTGKIGKFSLRHSYHKTFDIVSMREALTTGRSPFRVTLDHPKRIHELHEEGVGTWIADWPIEIRQHKEALKRMNPRGRILVGGLGIGIMASLLAEIPEVTHIDVVEISPEVAELCKPKSPKVQVHVADLAKFLEAQKKWIWDSAFIDIWQGTSEETWWSEVLPLRRLIGRKFGAWTLISCQFWAEDVMMGQVAERLMQATPAHWYYTAKLKLPMSKQRLRHFITQAGTPGWERRYKKALPDYKEEE